MVPQRFRAFALATKRYTTKQAGTLSGQNTVLFSHTKRV